MDIDQLRQPDILLHGLGRADKRYTLYYDETNNIRRLHVTPEGLNVADPGCFVLAGVGHPGDRRSIDITPLRKALRLQPTTREMKLVHIGKGDFLDLLRSPRLGVFLDWIDETGLFLHYQCLDVIYWSLVDIVDSALMAAERTELLLVAPLLKDMLNIALRRDLGAMTDLLRLFNYPALDPRDGPHFYQVVLQIVQGEAEHLHPLYGSLLADVLADAIQGDSFPFIEGSADDRHILIDGFDIFFRHRIGLLRNSTHILDLEEVVRRQFIEQPLLRDGVPLESFQFVDSAEEPMIQLADVVAGLLGKFFSYLVRTDMAVVLADRAALGPLQMGNLGKLAGLIDRASDENEAFAHRVLSLSDDRKAQIFMQVQD
ncbi:DUF3800 domain-containing protein [Sphingobium yanoikuyae]|jgi:hypothetical protein|uniref:DUF3800 domain-containing protein n=1 Tax=Sphingobium yanoikuyae TaxID=13690 RepID=UPI0013779560|nr:DUF3800 domain-containing protein [Sphingobium yanoikuyae]KAK0346267.1 hypothetical protein LTR94_007394 [Friedmanniomyces endolithicus]NBB39149.1 DUF3800 domain-containing protein [Sphingobium yanoikuyae]